MNIKVEGLVLPNKPLTNSEIISAAKKLRIPNFRGVFQRDVLPKKSLKKECGILNLDDSQGYGSHWTAWFKNNSEKYYFDSFGVQPPLELRDYLKPPIYYNTEQVQPRDQVCCGHLCLYVLKHLTSGKDLQKNNQRFVLIILISYNKNECE